MKRVPVVPTAIVTLAVALMIALGLWQLLIRLPLKEAQLAQLAANPRLPPVAFPAVPDERLLFRRSTLACPRPGATKLAGAGAAGFRAVVDCGDGRLVGLGTTHDPFARVAWGGGTVGGHISHAPDRRPLIASLWDRTAKPLMLVADAPPPGLARNTPPDISAVPNNHLAYAVQWFLFAAMATVIYVLALRRRT